MRRVPERSARLIIDIIGVMPLPPPNSSNGTLPSLSTKRPAGGSTSSVPPSFSASLNQLEPLPPVTRFTVTLSCAVDLRRARQRVAAVEGALVVRHPEGQELAGAVLELVGEVGRHVEHEGARVGRFLDDLGDAQLMVSHC